MKIPASVLRIKRASLRSKSTSTLQDMLAHQKNELEKLTKTSSKETFDYLHFSIVQKITLIEDELKSRELSNNCQV